MLDWNTTSTILCGLRDHADRVAWERLCARFRAPMVGFARRLGLNEADAEDAAQQALMAFAEAYRLGRYDRGKGRLSDWLFGIAYREIMSERRRYARRAVRLEPGGGRTSLWEALPDEGGATRFWDQEWEQALLERCLTQVQREVEEPSYRAFELVVRHHQSADQAAELLGVPVKSVYNAKHRILKRIRELRAAYEAVE